MKRLVYATTDVIKNSIDSKWMAPYKGYRIEKSWRTDSKGRPIKDTEMYAVIDDEDDWIGDAYKTVKEAHDYINDLVRK